MVVPFFDPTREYRIHKEEIDAAIHGVLSSGQLVLGHSPHIEKFEKEFAKFIGVKHAIMCGAGTHALYLAYRALGIGPGDEVITTSHTYIATIDQIVAVGANPILADINEKDGLIDILEIKKKITNKTRVIVLVHLEGKICDIKKMHKILRELNRKDIYIIEDSCQAIGAKL